jgi:uncharacterized metal-binding protein YceD (DUF177 family)
LQADAGDCAILSEADVVGPVQLEGKADIGPKETVVDLRVRLSTREICGRSLEEFEHPLDFAVRLLLRRSNEVQGVEWEDDGDEVWEAKIADDLRELDIEEVLRQAVELERPISPVKPGVPLPEGVLPEHDPEAEKAVDPRWEALRKLKEGRS